MSSDSHSADPAEASALKGFIAIVLVVLLAAVGVGLKFGLAGIGGLAIAGAGAMLAFLVLLTAG